MRMTKRKEEERIGRDKKQRKDAEARGKRESGR
jgi:hypothetical protein